MRVNYTSSLWNITEDGNKVNAKVNTGRKLNPEREYDKKLIDNGIAAQSGYVYESTWVTLVGEAYNRFKKHELKDGALIIPTDIEVKTEPYYGQLRDAYGNAIEGSYGKVYPKTPRVTIFDFKLPEENTSYDKAPRVEEVPTSKAVEKVNEAAPEINEDECPF